MNRNDLTPEGLRVLSAFKITLVLGVGIGLTTAVGLSFQTWFEAILPDRPMARSVIVVLAVSSLFMVVMLWRRDDLERLIRSTAVELYPADLTARPFLVTGLSWLADARVAELHRRCTEQNEPHDPARISADPGEKERLGGWQQNVRLVQFLRTAPAGKGGGALKAVYVIDNGAGHIEGFVEMLRTFFPGLSVVALPEAGAGGERYLRLDSRRPLKPDYEHYEYVTGAFDLAFDRIMRDHGLSRDQAEAATYIDVTPGFKVFSIAAAIQTLNRGAMFLYVTSFSDPDRVGKRPGGYTILGYDARAEFNLRR